jgi:hypothetical protein
MSQQAIEQATFPFTFSLPDVWDESDATPPAVPCVICLVDLAPGDACRRLPCLHTFHARCVETWLPRSRACPTCKADVEASARARV